MDYDGGAQVPPRQVGPSASGTRASGVGCGVVLLLLVVGFAAYLAVAPGLERKRQQENLAVASRLAGKDLPGIGAAKAKVEKVCGPCEEREDEDVVNVTNLYVADLLHYRILEGTNTVISVSLREPQGVRIAVGPRLYGVPLEMPLDRAHDVLVGTGFRKESEGREEERLTREYARRGDLRLRLCARPDDRKVVDVWVRKWGLVPAPATYPYR